LSPKSNLSKWWLPIILIIATLLRLYKLDFSFSNDELSALSRLRYDTFNDLIWKGVGEDFHPAFVQLFLYLWSNLFGISEFVTRLPFVVAGVASVYLVYRLGLLLFSEQTALLAAACISTLSFFILYSQLARPYSFGLFFVLAAAIGWVQIIKGSLRIKWLVIAGGFTALAMYTHYFSFMTVGIIWLALLPQLNRSNNKNFVLATLLSGALFIPHMGITLLQLSYGGVGSWLGAPTPSFWTDFLMYIFNSSNWLLALYVAIAILLTTVNYRQIKLPFWQVFCLLIFITPMVIGYYYSIYINPVLQFSTLLFSTPFILLLLFSFINNNANKKVFSSLLAILLIVSIYSTVFHEKHFEKQHFGVFKELTEKMIDWDMSYGTENITHTACVHGDYYLNYYFHKFGHQPSFATYFTVGDSAMAAMNEIIQNAKTDYFAFCWSTMNIHPETLELIRLKYPKQIDSEIHFNSGTYLFAKNGLDERTAIFSTGNLILVKSPYIPNLNTERLDTIDGKLKYTMRVEDEYSLTFECKAGDLTLKGDELLVAHAILNELNETDLQIVYSINKEDGTAEWYGNKLHPVFYRPTDNSQHLILSRRLPKLLNQNDVIKVYLWKTSKSKILVEDLCISIY
jgi:hypothetical protein